jgi:4-carboxymuconolactone decarboxylase
MARRGELNIFRLLANAPAVFDGWTRMTDELLDSPTFTLRARELVILRVAYLQNSPYELAQHIELGRHAGISPAELDAVALGGDLDCAGLSDTELAVLNLVTELCTTKQVREETFGAVKAALGAEATTELLMIVSLYYGLALILNAVELDLDYDARIRG